MKSLVLIITVAALMFCNQLSGEKQVQAMEMRPENWAQPIAVDGIPNLHKVSDKLYRSAQPTEEGIAKLKEMGIVTIINLRTFHSDSGKIGKTDIEYEHIYMQAWYPEEEDIIKFLKIVTSREGGPVLVHCQHGADRTGTVCAIYRIVVQGWTKEDALREMRQGGFGFHEVWKNLPAWIEKLDIEAIKKKAGLASQDKK